MNPFFPLFLTILGIIYLILGILRLSRNISSIGNEKFKKIISKWKISYFKCFLAGIFITMIAQSSSAVTLIALTFLANKLINNKQTLLLIIGANIGTTFTSFIIGFNFKYIYILFFIVGFIFLYIIKKDIINNIGKVLICLGLIFLGLEVMEKGLNLLLLNNNIPDMILKISNYSFLSFLLGIFISAILQSSSATIAITQNFYHLNLLSIVSAIAIMLGANIGTTLTGYLGMVTKNKNVFIVATINLLFNLIGGLWFFLFINSFSKIIIFFGKILSINKFHVISLSHFLFNFLTAIIFVAFILLYKERKSNSCVL